MKGHLLKQIENMANSFNPETLIIAKQADMQFYHTLPDIVKMYQEFGMVFSYSLYVPWEVSRLRWRDQNSN